MRRPLLPLLPTRPWLLLLFCMGLACGVTSGCASAPAGNYPEAAEILEVSEQLQERFSAGDLLGVADFYQSDAVLLGPGGHRIEGRAAIDAYWSSLVDPQEWRLVTRSIEGGEGLAYQRGTSFLTSRWDGEMNTSEVEFLLLWTRDQDARWKILMDSYWERSEDPPSKGL